MVLYYLRIAAVLGKCISTVFFLKKTEREKVIVYAFDVTAALVKPSACLVYKP